MKTRTQFLALEENVAKCREMLSKAPLTVARKEKAKYDATIEVATTENSKLVCKAAINFINALGRKQLIHVRVCRCSTINGECISLNVSETDAANLYFTNPDSEKMMYASILDFGKYIVYACQNDLSELNIKKDEPKTESKMSWIAHPESGCLFIDVYNEGYAEQLAEVVAEVKCDINDKEALLEEYKELCQANPDLGIYDCSVVQEELPF